MWKSQLEDERAARPFHEITADNHQSVLGAR